MRTQSQQSGKPILLLVANSASPDPYAVTEQGLGPGPLTEWSSRVYLPLRASGPLALSSAGWKLKTPETVLPTLIVLNSLGEERGRIEGLPGWQAVREFLRAWSTVPLRSSAKTQWFHGDSVLRGNGEGKWVFERGGPPGNFWEYTTAGPYLIVRSEDESFEAALPEPGGWVFWREIRTEKWERAFRGVFE